MMIFVLGLLPNRSSTAAITRSQNFGNAIEADRLECDPAEDPAILRIGMREMELKFLGQVEVLDVVAVRGSREENRRPLEPADSLGPTSSRFVMTFVDHDQPESPMKFLRTRRLRRRGGSGASRLSPSRLFAPGG